MLERFLPCAEGTDFEATKSCSFYSISQRQLVQQPRLFIGHFQ